MASEVLNINDINIPSNTGLFKVIYYNVYTGRNHNRYCIWGANTGSWQGDFVKPEKMPLPTEITIADILKKNGYCTAIYGKWHLGDLKAQKGGNKK